MAFLHGVEVLEINDGIRAIQTVRSSVIGLVGTAPDADAAKFPLDTPVLVTGPRAAEPLGAAGTLKGALDGIFDQAGRTSPVIVVVRVDEGIDEAGTLANLVGDQADGTGVHALKAAQTEFELTPRLLVAPGFTHQRPAAAANPVVAELLSLAATLRAVVIADAPNTNLADATTYVGDFGSDRLYVVDPHVKVLDAAGAVVEQPASSRVAGIIARVDNEQGFWWSPSNKPVNGIVGTARPVSFAFSDTGSDANLLNEAKVATVIRQDGFRLWGNRTASADPLWAFLSVRRTADLIYDSVERAHLWAMDRPFSRQLISDIQESVAAYLRQLKALGAIIDGRVWLDAELNSEAALIAGQLFIDFDIEPPAPLERLTFRAHRNAGYYQELVGDLVNAA